MKIFQKFLKSLIKKDDERAIFSMTGEHIPNSNITSLAKPKPGKNMPGQLHLENEKLY